MKQFDKELLNQKTTGDVFIKYNLESIFLGDNTSNSWFLSGLNQRMADISREGVRRNNFDKEYKRAVEEFIDAKSSLMKATRIALIDKCISETGKTIENTLFCHF